MPLGLEILGGPSSESDVISQRRIVDVEDSSEFNDRAISGLQRFHVVDYSSESYSEGSQRRLDGFDGSREFLELCERSELPRYVEKVRRNSGFPVLEVPVIAVAIRTLSVQVIQWPSST